MRAFRCLILLALALGAAACGRPLGTAGQPPPARQPIRIASKDFPEQYLLGQMYALLLEAAGLPVELRTGLGDTPALHAELTQGTLDLYPEYTGTALQHVLLLPGDTDPDHVYATVAQRYREQFKLVWLDRAPMNNTYVLALASEQAAKFNLATISDLAARASQFTLSGPSNFATRADGLPGLERAYGFRFKRFIGFESGLRYKSLVDGQSDVIVAYGTDPEIAQLRLVSLRDDRGFFPPYQVAPVVRLAVLEAYPQLAGPLNRLAPLLTDDTMRRLNNEVSGKKREPREVAREFLISQGLLEPQR
ncbi:MAG TPA: glycine betaine ABC transporter substrate-binding protein [Herpetosiphonaceae bacterium]